MNNKLPEWRKTLNKAVENYQSMRAWYEENPDNPSAEQDMDAAEGDIEKLIRQHGVLIVLNLLDEIDELQERRKADSAEPACYALTNMAGEVYNTHSSAQNAGAYRDLIHQSDDSLTLRVTPLYTVPPAPVVPDDWVMVPKEPTRQMMAQGHFAMKGTDRGKFRRIYQAMITAAPDLNKGGINAE
ncbi:hypothetical protein NRH68_001344 [Salmonella enterica]|nr:hypothetical protein [Salmonella enterica]EJB6988772.1 hypothetical protein [Salmonella enterica]EJO3531861.1 hypothetical protein [Salmonella enterica]EKY8785093.1 hypothetical protein [Salmonella enterica]EKY8868010.1 hypothetical protein [Salmonella enterica]